jgi:hypothetical protein
MEHVEPEDQAMGAALLPEHMSLYLIGSVAVGVIIVEGPTPDLKFSDAEKTKVAAEVQLGLTWLAKQEPKASITWAFDIQVVQLDVPADPSLSGYQALEGHWRDPAMKKLGFAPNWLGVRDYVKSIRRTKGTRWGYVAYFTKYPVHHFAYALQPRLVMHYQNDGWGPENIDRVFTHETGHIFGAPDEYASSGCKCPPKFGYLREPNGNCQNCASPFVECLMAANTWAMCAHTPVHLGWRDSDNDGTLDPVDPMGNPLIDLGRLCSTLPFLCQLLGLGRPAGVTGGIGLVGGVAGGVVGEVPPQPRPESVPTYLLRRVLSDAEMAKVEAAVQAEERQYLEAVERKLRAAADALRSEADTGS